MVEIKLDEMRIASWCLDELAQLPPEQVHFLLKMEGLEDYTFLMRFKGPDTLGFLIEELARYRREVWTEAEPVNITGKEQ